MKNYITIMCMFFACMAINAQTTITSQADWNAIGNSVNSGNSPVTVLAGVTVNGAGVSINTSGHLIIEAGATVNDAGATFIFADCSLTNYGTLSIAGSIVINTGATVVNTGTITAPGASQTNGTINNCGTMVIQGQDVSANFPVIPAGTACDDADDATSNDVYDDACTCAGEGAEVSAVPTMGEWGLMIMGLLIMIFGVVALQSRRETVLS